MLKAKIKPENRGLLLFSSFYIAAGVIEILYFLIENSSAPPHIGVLGLISLITAFGLLKMKRWSVLFATGLFLVGTAFSVTTLYNSILLQTFERGLLFHLAFIAYAVMLLAACLYVLTKRERFE